MNMKSLVIWECKYGLDRLDEQARFANERVRTLTIKAANERTCLVGRAPDIEACGSLPTVQNVRGALL
jgi:hypothetical protein